MIDHVSYANTAASYAGLYHARPSQPVQDLPQSSSSERGGSQREPNGAMRPAQAYQSVQLYRATTETFLQMLEPQQDVSAEETAETDPIQVVQDGNQRSQQAFSSYMKAQALQSAA